MKFIVELNNKTKKRFLKKDLQHIFKKTIEFSKLKCSDDSKLEVSIAMVNGDEIAVLNNQYRKKNSPTDVLSFSEYESSGEVQEVVKRGELFLGELILCPEYIEKNAKEDGESFEYAMTYIVAHGILHLLGLPHGKKMFSIQKNVADFLVKK